MARTATAPARTPRPAAPRPAVPRRPVEKRPGRRGSERELAGRGALSLDRLLGGRAWIALVGGLLTGIVFLNVSVLRLNEGIARTSERITAVKRENARLRMNVARLGSTERIQREAAARGFFHPQPGSIRFVAAGAGDARRAARTLASEPAVPAQASAEAPSWLRPPAGASGEDQDGADDAAPGGEGPDAGSAGGGDSAGAEGPGAGHGHPGSGEGTE